MRVRIKVFGQVQGVFFRSNAKDVAEKLGLVGWVKNNPNGSVETLAQGTKENLGKFLTWCKRGPSGAKVDKVEVEWGNRLENYDNFDVIY